MTFAFGIWRSKNPRPAPPRKSAEESFAMPHVIDQLLALRVADVMAKNVVVISANQTMGEVAQVLRDNEVSSGPVVDEAGRCVGILTASDFVKRECEMRQRERAALSGDEPSCCEAGGDRPYRLTSSVEDFAEFHMSPAVQAIDPGASLLKAARVMCAEHIHRLLVLNEFHQPVGVISTMDIVAALVNVVDELQAVAERRRPQASAK
jgi:CBS domain-containing protein